MNRYNFLSKNILAFFLVAIFFGAMILFSGCGNEAEINKLKEEISQKDSEITVLNQTIEKLNAENDVYEDEGGHKITVIGGRILERENDILVYSLPDRKGFAIWLQNDVPYSGENVFRLSKRAILVNTEYKAVYSCIGFMAIKLDSGNLDTSGNATGASYKEFATQLNGTTTLVNAKYSFDNNMLTTNIATSELIQVNADEIRDVTNSELVNFVDKQTNTGANIWFVKLYVKDGVDPYNYQPAEGEEHGTADGDCVSVFIMDKITLSNSSSISKCISIDNRKAGEEEETKVYSIRIRAQ